MPLSPSINATTTRTPRTGAWVVPALILLGSIAIGFFTPWLLFVAVGALIWLGIIHQNITRALRSYQSAVQQRDQELARIEQLVDRLGSILDSAEVPIIATNQRGQIVLANTAAQTILGSGRVLTGEHFDSLIPQSTVHELERLARSGEPGRAKLQLPIGGDMRIFSVAAEPVSGTGGTVCTFTDITELTQSATLKADFAANASHELRTPIASICGAIETLRGPARDDPQMSDRLITMIANNANRLELMVKDLLDLSKLESTEIPTSISRFDLIEHIDRVCVPLAGVCERRGLHIEIQNADEIGCIESDAILLELILRNLIGNATKFARENTPITIRLESKSIAHDPQNPPPEGLDSETGLRIGIRDQGIGIPLMHQTRIFERFYQVDEARSGSTAKRGTGLGLAIVKHAARTLGGTVQIQSIHHQGTTMIVDLPNCLPQSSE